MAGFDDGGANHEDAGLHQADWLILLRMDGLVQNEGSCLAVAVGSGPAVALQLQLQLLQAQCLLPCPAAAVGSDPAMVPSVPSLSPS